MKKKNKIPQKLTRQIFFQYTLPMMCILLLWNEYGEMKLSWSYLFLFIIEFIVGTGIAYLLAVSWANQISRRYLPKK